MDARDHILAKHPTLVVIGAHIGSLEYDVDEVAKRLDTYPNFNVEVSARTRDLTRQPSNKVRAFFLKYQDRILYGTDQSWRPYRTPEVTPTDAERAKFSAGLEAQYRRDWAYYAGTGRSTTAANASRVSLCRRPCSRSSIGRTPSASSACASRAWCQFGLSAPSIIRARSAPALRPVRWRDPPFHEADDVADGSDAFDGPGLCSEMRPSAKKPDGSERTNTCLLRT